MPAKKNVFIFGDSITYGEWDSQGGWANRLRAHYDSLVLPLPEDFVISYNLGIPSDTSAGVAQRLTQETQSRLNPNPHEKEIQIIIAIGTNDSRWFIEGKTHEIERDQFKANIETITASAKAFTDDIVFIGLLPCVEEDVLKTAKRHQWDVHYDNQSLKAYNEIIKQHCFEGSLDFIELFELFEKNDPKSLIDDGLHPNSKGHSLMYAEILKRLS